MLFVIFHGFCTSASGAVRSGTAFVLLDVLRVGPARSNGTNSFSTKLFVTRCEGRGVPGGDVIMEDSSPIQVETLEQIKMLPRDRVGKEVDIFLSRNLNLCVYSEVSSWIFNNTTKIGYMRN